ncbi:hypothetical protein PTSG_03540 [Salpingoeca rosetta]|uniref:PH domain-containing protein n=1 Tax=Salpingoeca rosetta (strain ATCC 50818 / BSB-021) TaxID=946362 RepID=F2U5W7_SALR5|nr:uncharacterized protein PTSG_03540 [Salpingoeca rosetta]EGD82908.1 hypothetical protein PTSG_03540 [Salpingoeca rosetta]|eukprot:XP_004995272.1 hypothetical protein PTSG_03540 [Salpingoeca rosetta]
MSDEEDDPTKVYPWQKGTPAEVKVAIEKRRQQLLACDLASNPEAQREWIVLLQERNVFAVTELEESKEQRKQEQMEQHMPPLCGWLLKRNSKFPFTFRRRWFVYDDNAGLLLYYRDTSTNKKPMGFLDLGELDTIRSEDATGRRFKLVTPSREWQLMAGDAAVATAWMSEIRDRQASLKEKRSAAFTSAPTIDYEEEEDDEDEEQVVEYDDAGLLFRTSDKTTFEIIEHMEAASSTNASRSHAFGSEAATTAPTPEDDTSETSSQHQQQQQQQQAMADHMSEERAKLYRELALRQQALKSEMRDGVTVEELSARLAWSQTELAHTRALLDLSNQRIAGAMEALAFYKAMLDGAQVPTDTREAIWLSQLENAQQALDASNERNDLLQQEIDDLKAQLGRRE